MARGSSRTKLAKTFCRCIKRVRKTVRARGSRQTKAAKESAAIGICVKSVLGTRGRTLHKFTCDSSSKGRALSTKSGDKKPKLSTQDPK